LSPPPWSWSPCSLFTYAPDGPEKHHSHLKLGARYYNPTTGRFTQPDPSGQEANNYAYAGGDPINHTDPSGLGFWGKFSLGMDVVGLGLLFVGLAISPVGIAAMSIMAVGVILAELGVGIGAACEFGGLENC